MKYIMLILIAGWLTACSGPKAGSVSVQPRDAQYQRITASAHGAFQRGDIERAAVLFEQAYQRAHVMDRSSAIADSAYHLAICRIALGDTAAAMPLLDESRWERQAAGQSIVPALLAQAETARIAGQGEKAWILTEEALTHTRDREERTQLHGLRALLALESDDFETATSERIAAQRAASRSASPRLLARLAEIDGRLALRQGNTVAAATAFEREAAGYAQAGRYTDMARATVRAAAAYAAGGANEQAVDAYFRAARHYAAAGDPLLALTTIKTALPLVSELESDVWAGRMALLVDQVSEAVKKTSP